MGYPRHLYRKRFNKHSTRIEVVNDSGLKAEFDANGNIIKYIV